MEKIKVNMSPNPLDVQTIHASQNDGEARQWEFELHNNGEIIDSSEVTDQMVFKAYKGGTEQLLPENGSVPVTSPFLGDIRYPQGLLTDQEFTYRQSPTEEDGLAFVEKIKGNTLNWNQLVQNGNFASTSGFTTWACTISVSNNVLTFKASQTSGNFGMDFIDLISGHKYLLSVTIQKESANSRIQYGFQYGYAKTFLADDITNKKTYNQIITSTYTGQARPLIADVSTSDYANVYVSNYMVIDLTAMGLDSITDPSDFTSLFSLPYYSYNQGSLLSFNGTGLKTVGFNQWDEEWEVGSLNASSGLPIESAIQIRSKNYCPCISGLEYYFHSSKTDGGSQNIYYFAVFFYDVDKNFVSRLYTNRQKFRVPTNASYFKISSNSSVVVYGNEYLNDICINISSSRDGEYEPYTSSTLSLPISTYFPNGMKSAGSVYDELTESKAITRVRMADMGTLSFFYNASAGFFSTNIPSLVNGMTYATESPNVIVQNYEYKGGGVGWANMPNMSYGFNGQDMRIKNTAYTTTADFTNAVRGTYMVYELATPTETSFTTASLVTENGEIPLSNEDGTLIGKCTEELSAEQGFIDAKIKLTDGDGTCYSNKIQLHVERKPS